MKVIHDVENVAVARNSQLSSSAPSPSSYLDDALVVVRRLIGTFIDVKLVSVDDDTGVHIGRVTSSNDLEFVHGEEVSFVYRRSVIPR
jgi:hypothetical protein